MGIGRFIGRAIAALIALALVAFILLPVVAIGILLLKIAIVVMLASWLMRKIFGRSRRHEPILVGGPVATVAAPRRDRYEVEAERELDRELGL